MKTGSLIALLIMSAACGESSLADDAGTDAGNTSDTGAVDVGSRDAGPSDYDAGPIPACPADSEANMIGGIEDFLALIPDLASIELENVRSRQFTATAEYLVAEDFTMTWAELPMFCELACNLSPLSEVSGVDADRSARTISFAAGARFRIRVGRENYAPVFEDQWFLNFLPGCSSECPVGQQLCPVDLVCYEDGISYCEECRDLHPADCACAGEGQRPLPNGTECEWAFDNSDIGIVDFCEAGSCGESRF